jgi:hypothetical protein
VRLVLPLLVAVLALGASPARADGAIVDLRILLVLDGQPETAAIREALAAGGVPTDTVDLADPTRARITLGALTWPDAVPHSRYQAVVLPSEAPEGLAPDELAAIQALERRFGLRELAASVQPVPASGLADSSWSGQVDGATAQLTDAAKADGFGDMRGPVPLDADTWAEIGAPLPGYTPMLTVNGGPVAGVWRADGREVLGLTFTFETGSTHFAALAPGLVEWLTKGLHLGARRSYLAVHIDDVLLPDARWIVGMHCAYGADCPPTVPPAAPIRMTPADVVFAADWSRRHGFRLDLAFNGAGSAAVPDDPLLAALVADKAAFGWLNHTWSHQYLGCVRDYSTTPWRCATVPLLGWTRYVPGREIEDQIARNVAFAREHGLPIDESELVTGEHSGLRGDDEMAEDNPRLAGALGAEGVRTLASDASKESGQRGIGDALTVPRHPIDLDYDTATYAETVDQYTWSHSAREDGGDGTCEADAGCQPPVDATDPAAGFANQIVPAESAKVLSHVLDNDPRPHYVHQPQLAGDRTLYPVLDRVLAEYAALYTGARPLLVPTMTQSRDELARRVWTGSGSVQDGVITVSGTGFVPLTVPSGVDFGEAYGTGRSGWVAVDGEVRV